MKTESSNFQSFMTTAKLFFGNAYLSIPSVFMSAGLFGGIVMFSLVGLLNCFTMLQILKVADRHPNIGTYSKLSLKVFGTKGKIVVDVCIWIMQLSICISYLFFISEQLAEVISDQTNFQRDKTFYILLLTIPAMPICWFNTYTFLSYFSIAGISVALIAMVCIFGFCIDLFSSGSAVYTPINYFNLSGMFGHIGVAMFVFEGNAVIMNVRAETKNKH